MSKYILVAQKYLEIVQRLVRNLQLCWAEKFPDMESNDLNAAGSVCSARCDLLLSDESGWRSDGGSESQTFFGLI